MPVISSLSSISSIKSGSLEYLFGKSDSILGFFREKKTPYSASVFSSDRPSISSLPSYRSQYSWRSSKSSSFIYEDDERTTINAIACDGGGVRGASTAKIISIIMDDLAKVTGKEENAWENFDLMAGTSTGGLIVLMLGRLRIPVDILLSAYSGLSKSLFKSHIKYLRSIVRGSKYSSTLSKKCFEKVVAENSNEGAKTPLYYEPVKTCDVFVTSVNIADASGEPLILRSYDTEQSFTVAESAQATTAAPTYFPAKTLSNGQVAVDGGVRFNNPTELVIKEARRKYGNGVKFGLLLSIGTGEREPLAMKDSKSPIALLSLPTIMGKLITDSEAVHERIHARFEETDLGTYVRINVPLIGEVRLDNYKAITSIITATEEYMSTPHMLEVRKEIVNIFLANLPQNNN